jgi:RNA polymerase sigma factor (TIGR02999 family)
MYASTTGRESGGSPLRPSPNSGQPHDSTHLLALAAKAMRQVLVDRARARQTAKRGSGAGKIEFDESISPGSTESSSAASIDFLALDEAITNVERVDPRLAELITLRFFAGLTVQQAATVLGVGTFTAEQE